MTKNMLKLVLGVQFRFPTKMPQKNFTSQRFKMFEVNLDLYPPTTHRVTGRVSISVLAKRFPSPAVPSFQQKTTGLLGTKLCSLSWVNGKSNFLFLVLKYFLIAFSFFGGGLCGFRPIYNICVLNFLGRAGSRSDSVGVP